MVNVERKGNEEEDSIRIYDNTNRSKCVNFSI